MKFKISITILLSVFTFSIFSHEIDIKDKAVEEIVKMRMNNMSAINTLSKKLYKDLNSENLDLLNDHLKKIKKNVLEFKNLFPQGSEGGKSKELIWSENELFNEYIANFLIDINAMIEDIENKDLLFLKDNFNKMSSNCGKCHKKFKSR